MSVALKWLGIWAGWTAVALLFTAEVLIRGGSVYPISNREVIARNLISAYIWLGLTPLVLTLAKRIPVDGPGWKSNFLVHIAAAAAAMVVHVTLFTVIVSVLDLTATESSFWPRFQNLFTFNYRPDLIFYCLIVAAVTGLRRYRSDSGPQEQPSTELAHEAGITRIPVRSNGRITLVQAEDVDWFEADDNYVRVHTGERSHLVREKIGRLESQLDKAGFLRIHRSVIVNTRRIKELRPMPGGVYEVEMKDGKVVRSGRKFKEHVVSLLGK